MSADIEELLRDGMDRFTAGVQAPPGLARRASQLQRRRRGIRAAVACGTAAVTAAAAVAISVAATGTQAPPAVSGVHARTAAYVVNQVEKALARTNLVFYGHSASNGGPDRTWAYGLSNRTEEHFRGAPYTTQGTALIHGKLTGVYVMYFEHKWSLLPEATPASACSRTGALEMGGPPLPMNHWSSFINQTLACGAAGVTGHVRINGMETTKITGRPITVRMSPGEARAVHEKWARARWTLYVNPRTYLPVRIIGSTESFGGSGGDTLFRSVTDAHWLPPTRANIAKALVTIPAGFRQVSSPAD
jgi:hypothetical protein